MGLHCTTLSAECPFDVAGFTFAGFPGVVIGHNQQIAWGFTNLGPDVSDLYLEAVDGERYLRGDEWRDFADPPGDDPGGGRGALHLHRAVHRCTDRCSPT